MGTHLNIMKHNTIIDMVEWAMICSPQDVVALIDRENDADYAVAVLAGIFRQRARSDLEWMWVAITTTPDAILALEPHLGVIQAGSTSFPPAGMDWRAYAACLERADDAFAGYRPEPATVLPMALQPMLADAAPSSPPQSGQLDDLDDLDDLFGLSIDSPPHLPTKNPRQKGSAGRKVDDEGGLF